MLTFRIMDGDYEDETLRLWKPLRADLTWSLRNVLVNLGLNMEDVLDEENNISLETDSPDMDIDPCGVLLEPELVGRTCTLQVVIQQYNGRDSSSIDRVLDDEGIDREKAQREQRKASRNGSTPAAAAALEVEEGSDTAFVAPTPAPAANGAAPRRQLSLRKS
jgi:hypothetical protein